MKKQYVTPAIRLQEMECCELCGGSIQSSTIEEGAEKPGLSKQSGFDFEDDYDYDYEE